MNTISFQDRTSDSLPQLFENIKPLTNEFDQSKTGF